MLVEIYNDLAIGVIEVRFFWQEIELQKCNEEKGATFVAALAVGENLERLDDLDARVAEGRVAAAHRVERVPLVGVDRLQEKNHSSVSLLWNNNQEVF